MEKPFHYRNVRKNLLSLYIKQLLIRYEHFFYRAIQVQIATIPRQEDCNTSNIF